MIRRLVTTILSLIRSRDMNENPTRLGALLAANEMLEMALNRLAEQGEHRLASEVRVARAKVVAEIQRMGMGK